jgi:hypothetical protein
MFTFKTKPQSLTEIVVSGLSLYWKGIQSLWPWSLGLAVLTGIPTLLVGYLMRYQYGNRALLFSGLFTLLLLPLVIFIVSFIIRQFYLIGSQTKESFTDSVNAVMKKLPLLLIALPVISILSWIGLILFFAPGIFIAVMLVFTAPLILLDDHSIVDAFRYSCFLVWKSWWRTFSIIVIPMILSILVSPYNYTATISLTKVSLSIIEMALINPLFLSLMLTMYYDAKLRHNLDLHLPKKKSDMRLSEEH